MKPWELLGETCTPDGSQVRLTRQDTEYVILVDGKPLMSSRRHGSEEALATLGCQHARTMDEPQVLVGGLGMGFTLRATLDLLPPGAIVTVAELLPAIVEWNRGPLGFTRRPPGQRPARSDRARRRGACAACVGAVRLRCNPAGCGQRPGRVHRPAKRRTLRQRRCLCRVCGAPRRRSAGRVVCLGRSQIRAAAALPRVRRPGRARPGPPEEGGAAPRDLRRGREARGASGLPFFHHPEGEGLEATR